MDNFEKTKAKIEQLLEDNNPGKSASNYFNGFADALMVVQGYMDTLPQEQDCTMKVVDTPTAVVQGWLNALRWFEKLFDSPSEEEVSEDLKAEVQRWRDHYMKIKEHGFQIGLRDVEAVAYHFAEWQKEKMMKGAVEGNDNH